MNVVSVARGISAAGHPLVVIPLTVALTTRSATWTVVIAATTIVPLTLVIARNVRRGTWSNFDVSSRDQRSGLYFWTLPLLALAAAVLYFLGAGPHVLRPFAAAAAMLAAGVIGNRFLKTSLHMMFAGFCGVMVGWLYPIAIVPLALAAGAIAWSRLHLERHTVTEIAVGTLLGVAAGLFSVW